MNINEGSQEGNRRLREELIREEREMAPEVGDSLFLREMKHFLNNENQKLGKNRKTLERHSRNLNAKWSKLDRMFERIPGSKETLELERRFEEADSYFENMIEVYQLAINALPDDEDYQPDHQDPIQEEGDLVPEQDLLHFPDCLDYWEEDQGHQLSP